MTPTVRFNHLILVLLAHDTLAQFVVIEQGVLEGFEFTTRLGRNVTSFLGIPFGKPPIGELRFEPPQPAEYWTGIRSAKVDPPPCPQPVKRFSVSPSKEDCLSINVYTPNLPSRNRPTKLLPTMVFIYGGVFKYGSNSFDFFGPQYLLDQEVVLAIPNYRLGPFGFLSTGDEVVPGNIGMKDQVLALHWVQRNIAAFGGDPDRVTVFGSSAGSISVNAHALSKLSDGLFHQFILQSGTVITPAYYTDPITMAAESVAYGNSLNCPTENSTVLVKCLRGLSMEEMLNAVNYVDYKWGITKEPDVEGSFLTDSPYNLLKQGKMKDVPWIVGTVLNEGVVESQYWYFDTQMAMQLYNNLRVNMTSFLTEHLPETTMTSDFVEAIIEHYISNTSNPHVVLDNYTKFMGDIEFIYPTIVQDEIQLMLGTAPSYKYSFEYRGTFSETYANTGNDSYIGVAHADELIYFFQNNRAYAKFGSMTETDNEMVDVMTGLWVSFATNGTPTLQRANEVFPWKEYEKTNRARLRIGSDGGTSLVMESNYLQDVAQFWRSQIDNAHGSSSSAIIVNSSSHSCQFFLDAFLLFQILFAVSNFI